VISVVLSDGKYTEEDAVIPERKKKSSSSSRDAASSNSPTKKKSAPSSIQLQEKKYNNHSDRGHQGQGRIVNGRHVEFSEHVRVRDNHARLDNGYADNGGYGATDEQSTLTNSRDIRETDIRFLNNNLTRDFETQKRLGKETGLTYVSAKVPGATFKPKSKTRITDRNIGEAAEMDGRVSDASHSDSESGKARKFKGLKNLDPGTIFFIKKLFVVT